MVHGFDMYVVPAIETVLCSSRYVTTESAAAKANESNNCAMLPLRCVVVFY
jgi:hypothetical protein